MFTAYHLKAFCLQFVVIFIWQYLQFSKQKQPLKKFELQIHKGGASWFHVYCVSAD